MYARFVKRFLDFIGASFLLLLSSPLFIVVAIIIKLTSRGPVFFKQERTGLHGKTFIMCKFRSMAEDNDVNDVKSGDKVTRVGKILRATSLDELPQFINIIRGDMSFIGPRPWIPAYYQHMNDEQRHRNDVRPGITGLAQAYGRNNLNIYEKINYDLQYVHNVSFCGDIRVIFVTIKMLFNREACELGKEGIHEELDILINQGQK
jgi:UDP-galactose phosphate transferase